MIDRSPHQIIFQVFERRLHLAPLHVELPEPGRVARGQVRAQQVTAFATPGRTTLLAIKPVDERGAVLGTSVRNNRHAAGVFCGAAPRFMSRLARDKDFIGEISRRCFANHSVGACASRVLGGGGPRFR